MENHFWNAKDIQQVRGKETPNADVWCFRFPCFVTGTLVQTRASIKLIERLK